MDELYVALRNRGIQYRSFALLNKVYSPSYGGCSGLAGASVAVALCIALCIRVEYVRNKKVKGQLVM